MTGPTDPALRALIEAVDRAAFSALVDAEDGTPEPEWQTRLWDAADEARAALAAAPLDVERLRHRLVQVSIYIANGDLVAANEELAVLVDALRSPDTETAGEA